MIDNVLTVVGPIVGIAGWIVLLGFTAWCVSGEIGKPCPQLQWRNVRLGKVAAVVALLIIGVSWFTGSHNMVATLSAASLSLVACVAFRLLLRRSKPGVTTPFDAALEFMAVFLLTIVILAAALTHSRY